MFGLLLIVVQFAHIFAANQCAFGDPVCWINFSNSVMVPTIADGIPELGVESLDTIHLKDIVISNDGIIFKLTNATILGFRDSFVEDIRNYRDLKILNTVLHTNLTIVGTYNAKGTFYTLPVTGNGKITLLMQNVHIEMLTPYDIVKIDNDNISVRLKYLKKFFHSYGGIKFNFENKDSDSKDFDEKAGVFVNENWRVFEEYGAEVWSDYTGRIFNAVKLIVASYEIKN